jgi:hypothetical protein
VRQQGIDRTLESLRRTMAEQDDEALVVQLALAVQTFRRDADFQRLMLRAALGATTWRRSRSASSGCRCSISCTAT